jgi:hypothetical protein
MAPSGIDLATFWFVAQCLNHCATTCPPYYWILLLNYMSKKGKIKFLSPVLWNMNQMDRTENEELNS